MTHEDETWNFLLDLANESGDFDWDDDDWDDADEYDFEAMEDECGEDAFGGCAYAGSEYCDWQCPFGGWSASK